MSTLEAAPIACTLTPGEMHDRLAWIANLNKEALIAHQREDLVLKLTFAPGAVLRVREMVRGEQACCAFLLFDLKEMTQEIRLTITAPEEARGAADALFEKFVAKAPAWSTRKPSCGCSAAKSAPKEPPGAKAVGATAITLSASAVACGACCVLPFTLPAAVLAGTGSLLSTLIHVHLWATVLSMIAVAGAWGWLAWQVRRTGRRPTVTTQVMMIASTGFMTISLMWPLIEKPLIQAVRAQ